MMDPSCEICGVVRNLDRHHVIPKRMGGRKDPAIHDEGNLMTLCRNCHQNLHDERWELVRSPQGIWVFDKRTGDQIMRRLYDSDVAPSALFQVLNVAEDSLKNIYDVVPYLADDQLVEAFAYACSIGKYAWLMQAAILYEAQQRSIHGDRTFEAVARRFEVSRRQAQKYALVWKVFFADDGGTENVNVDVFALDQPSWYVVAATETQEPNKWLAYAQDRKQEDIRYSISSFRRDIQQAGQFQVSADANPIQHTILQNVPLPALVQRNCPWIKTFCVQSGKPISVEDCNDCEFAKGTFCETNPI